MTVWKSRGLRGNVLEELISLTNEFYRKHKLGRVDKISVPIKVIDIDSSGMITKAFFEKKSTVDFQGIIQGIGVSFDAKETNLKSLPLQNIHEHQLEFMEDITQQNGIAFMIVHFKVFNDYYLLPYEVIRDYAKNSKTSRKSIPHKAMNPDFKIEMPTNGILNYLPALNIYMDYKSKDDFGFK